MIVGTNAVAGWASVLAAQPIDVLGIDALGKDTLVDTIRAHNAEEAQRSTGKAVV